jgi:tetratricopeptide (TPR) repeat protein
MAESDWPVAVVVVTGQGIESLPLFRFLHHHARLLKLYHYTDHAGFKGLTGDGAQWLPSLGVTLEDRCEEALPGHEDLFPSEAIRKLPSVGDKISAALAILLSELQQGMTDLASTVYGPGWYLTDLPPSSSTSLLLSNLWGGDPTKAPRTEYWVSVEVSEFKVRLPTPLRPHVRFLPVADRMAVSAENSLYGQSLSAVVMVAAGRRCQTSKNEVCVSQDFQKRTILVPPHQFLIEGWSRLPDQRRRNLVRYLGMRASPPMSWRSDSQEGQAINLLHTLAQRGEFDIALKHANSLIKEYPYVADLWSNQGLVLAKLGLREAALNSYMQAITLNPNYHQAWTNLSASLLKLGRHEESLCCANEAILNDPDSPDPWYNRGASLAEMNEWAAAASSYKQFVNLAPTHDRVGRAQAAIRLCGFRAGMKSLLSKLALRKGVSDTQKTILKRKKWRG